MAEKSKAVAAGTAHGSQINKTGVDYCPPERRANQRATLLGHLRQHGNISTGEARAAYRIMHPASRMLELRRQGHGIITRRDPIQKCARYVLVHDQDAEPLQP